MAVADPGRYAALAAMLALMVGGVFVVARLARLGWMADYFSHPVLVGYIHGIAIVLIVGQLEKLLGFDVDGDRVLDQLSDISRNLEATDAATVAVGVGSLVVLVALRLVARRVPAALIVVVGGIIVSSAVGLEADGVPVVGHVPSGLPSFEVPRVGVSEFVELIPAALGIFFVSFADAILTARSFAGRHGQRIDVRQEMGALGAANLASGLTQGYAVSSSSSRTAVNDQMGARTQVAGAVAAVVIAVVLLVLTAPVAYLPTACLGAVIIVAAAGLVSPAAWRTLARVDRVEVGIAATTTATVILVGVLQALVIAVALSILDVVRRSARPRDAVLGYVDGLGRWADVRFNPSARLTPGVVVYRLDDRLFFANASYFKGRIRESVAAAPPPVHSLVFDAESMNLVDSSGLSALADVVSQLRAEGIGFSVARMHGPVMADLERDGLADVIGRANFHPTVAAAVAACVTPPAAPPGP
jgi:SulP family sulfate permease